MGVAMGECGLSYHDFRALTVEELTAVVESSRRVRGAADKGEWERTRLHAVMTMQPHCKNRLDPRRILPLPWDASPLRSSSNTKADMGREESLARFLELARLQDSSPHQG